MNLHFTYAGIVESNQDPLKLGRLKVRVPHVYGINTLSAGYIGTNDLPWALPAGLPNGSTPMSGGFSMLPEPGDKVWVRFLDGEPEKPIWEWGMQTIDEAKNMKLHQYDDGIPVGSPNRTLWTRYNHAIEINAGSIIITTKTGYRLILTDAENTSTQDGNILLTTLKGNMLQLNDLDDTLKIVVQEHAYFNIGSDFIGLSDDFLWKTMTNNFTVNSGNNCLFSAKNEMTLLAGSNLGIKVQNNTVLDTNNEIQFKFNTLYLGDGASEAAVLGNMLIKLLENLLTWMDTHTHISGEAGTPTSQPIIPASTLANPKPSECVSQSIFVQK